MRQIFFFLLIAVPSVGSGAERPNIIFMLADDQGWSGLSVAMHPDVAGSRSDQFHTPSLEKMAARGMRFSSAYAPAPVCSPTRISLLTGQSPAALHWTKAAPPVDGRKLVEPRLIKNIPPTATTFAELLQEAGYATAHYGKWHVGGGGPGRHGFDEHDGDTGNEQAFKFTDPNPVDIFGMADRAAIFMERNAKSGKPFFIQLSWNALHASENALKVSLEKYQRQMSDESSKRIEIAAMTEDLDTGVGKVLQTIDQLGLSGNTFVIYMSDNGAGGGRRSPLRGGKGGVWEGGVRVPLIVQGPGVKAGSWCHTPVVGYDFFPTFCEWARVDSTRLPPRIEGGSITSLLSNAGRGDVNRHREELVFHFPHYQSDDGPQSAIRLGDFKLMKFYEDNRVMLFNLSNDMGERHDIAAQDPDRADQLRKRLENYLKEVDAQFPAVNPAFDPDQPLAPARGKRGGRKGATREGAL